MAAFEGGEGSRSGGTYPPTYNPVCPSICTSYSRSHHIQCFFTFPHPQTNPPSSRWCNYAQVHFHSCPDGIYTLPTQLTPPEKKPLTPGGGGGVRYPNVVLKGNVCAARRYEPCRLFCTSWKRSERLNELLCVYVYALFGSSQQFGPEFTIEGGWRGRETAARTLMAPDKYLSQRYQE